METPCNSFKNCQSNFRLWKIFTGPPSSTSLKGDMSPTSKRSMMKVCSGVASWRRRALPSLGERLVVSVSAPTASAPSRAEAIVGRSFGSVTRV
jgi:hypothetical protein